MKRKETLLSYWLWLWLWLASGHSFFDNPPLELLSDLGDRVDDVASEAGLE